MSESWLRLLDDPNPWSAPDPLPGPVRTARLVVRRYGRGDGPALFRAVGTQRERLFPWMSWATSDHRAEEDSVYYVERFRRLAEKPGCTDFPMGIFDAASGELVGGTGLHGVVPRFRQAEIGYWVRGDLQGGGLCTEAIGALISRALAPAAEGGWGLRRIVIFNAVDNVGSRRVCQKLGLRLECRMKAERYLATPGDPGGYHDTLGFAVLEEEWDFERHRARDGIGWDALDPG